MDMNQQQTSSSSATKKWLIGCGIGCGVIILIVVILIASGYFFIKNIVDEFKDTEAMTEVLTERFGRIPDFCPDPDGTIKAERIEAFLAARETFRPIREEIAKSMEILSQKKDVDDIEMGKPRSMFTMIRLGFGIIPQAAEFIKTRNEALLEAGMGLGEYYYIYAVAYYSWLGKNPEDGPGFQIIGPDENEDFGTWGEEDSKELRRERMLRRLNYRVVSAASGEEAVEYMRQNRADMLVLDMIMDPGIDGLETYRRILELHPRQPAVIVSGFSESDRARQAQALGAGPYVRKPYLSETLGVAVRRELDRSSSGTASAPPF